MLWHGDREVGSLTIDLSFGPPRCFPGVICCQNLMRKHQSFENVHKNGITFFFYWW